MLAYRDGAVGRAADAAVLIITGSPSAHALGGLPKNADYVKIPTLAQTGDVEARPPHLPIDVEELSSVRERLVCETLESFRPDVFLVDTHPLGTRRELRRALQGLRDQPTQVILGLRDIVDEPEAVRASWARDDVYAALESLYDRILVYGLPNVLEIVEAYGLSSAVGAKTHYCGYVAAEPPTAGDADRLIRELELERPLLVATVGGGGDGYPLLRDFLEATRLVPKASAIAVAGPMMGPVDRQRLAHLAAGSGRVDYSGSPSRSGASGVAPGASAPAASSSSLLQPSSGPEKVCFEDLWTDTPASAAASLDNAIRCRAEEEAQRQRAARRRHVRDRTAARTSAARYGSARCAISGHSMVDRLPRSGRTR